MVTCTPHIGASTDQAADAIALEVVRIVDVFMKTGRPAGAGSRERPGRRRTSEKARGPAAAVSLRALGEPSKPSKPATLDEASTARPRPPLASTGDCACAGRGAGPGFQRFRDAVDGPDAERASAAHRGSGPNPRDRDIDLLGWARYSVSESRLFQAECESHPRALQHGRSVPAVPDGHCHVRRPDPGFPGRSGKCDAHILIHQRRSGHRFR